MKIPASGRVFIYIQGIEQFGTAWSEDQPRMGNKLRPFKTAHGVTVQEHFFYG